MLRDRNFETSAGATALRRALLGTSAIMVAGLVSASPVYAECNLPVWGEDENEDPIIVSPIANGDTVTCASDHTTGLNTAASNITININSGVTVSGSLEAINLEGDNFALNNNGTISGTGLGHLIRIQNSSGGAIVNNGTINSTDLGVGIDFSSNVKVTNHGTIIAGTADHDHAVRFHISPNGTVENFGLIQTSEKGVKFVASNNAKVINHEGGVIESTALDNDPAVQFDGGDTFSLENRGTITSTDEGINARNGATAGQIDNYGTIFGTDNAVYISDSSNITIINHLGATMESVNNQAVGIRGSNFVIENHGDLIGAQGVSVEFVDTATIDNFGTITSTEDALRIDDGSTNIIITNHETGVINSGATWGGLSNRWGDNNTLTNLGTVNSQNDGFVGASGSGITLTNEGIVDAARYGVRINDATDVTVTNSGTITGGSHGLIVEGTSTNVSIDNAAGATIEGSVFSILGGDGDENVTNSGILTGNVDLGAGDDSFTLDLGTGFVSGTVDGGAGDDTFGFAGVGTTDILDRISNFETLDILSGSTFQFAGDDVSFATISGTNNFVVHGTLDVLSGALVVETQTELVSGTLAAAADASLSMIGAVSVTEVSKLQGEGAITISGPLIVDDGAIVTNMMSDIGDGLVLAGDNLVTGLGSLSNAGKLKFRSGTANLKQIVNQDNGRVIFEVDPDDASAERVIDTFFTNAGIVEQFATVTLGSDGVVINNGSWEINGGVNIEPQGPGLDLTLKNNSEANIVKRGDGGSRIEVFLQNDGDIDVNGGALILAAGGLFNNDGLIANITLSNGSEFILESIDNLNPFEFRGVTNILPGEGSGTFFIDGPLTGTGKLNILTDAEWLDGDIDVHKFSIGGDVGASTLTTVGDFKVLSSKFSIINENGKLVQDSDLTLGLDMILQVDGAYILNGHSVFRLSPTDFEELGSVVMGSAGLLISKANTANFIEAPFIGPKSFAVSVESNSNLTIANPFTGLLGGVFTGTELFAGAWQLGQNAQIELGGPGRNIHTIKNSNVEMSTGSIFNNFPNVDGDLLIKGTQALSIFMGQTIVAWLGGTLNTEERRRAIQEVQIEAEDALATLRLESMNFHVSGDMTLNFGSLILLNSQITIGGPNGLTVGDRSLLAGFGTVNGDTVMSGFTMPGSSPGTITINGNYTQTSSGTLFIEIGGTTPGTGYDQLIVNGTATFELGSSIEITMLDLSGGSNLFEPRTGDVFDFLVTTIWCCRQGRSLPT